jgi:hypothetical protein
MKVRVSQEHIENGVCKDSHHCMIADAIKATYPAAQYILVDLQSIRFSDPDRGERYTYLTPPTAQANLLRFDRGDKSIQPFTFTLNKPQIRVMGWAGEGRSATAKRKPAKAYRKSGKPRAVVAYKEREFGLRKFAVQ